MFVKVFSFNPKYKGLNENQKYSLEEKLKVNISKHLCNQIERDNNLYSFTTIVHFKIVDSLLEISPDDYVIYVVEKWPVKNPNNIKAFVPIQGGKVMYVEDFNEKSYLYSHEVGHLLGLLHKSSYRINAKQIADLNGFQISQQKLDKIDSLFKKDNLMFNKENDLQDLETYQNNNNPILEEIQFLIVNGLFRNQNINKGNNEFKFNNDWVIINQRMNGEDVAYSGKKTESDLAYKSNEIIDVYLEK
jgi:hypothetical protein